MDKVVVDDGGWKVLKVMKVREVRSEILRHRRSDRIHDIRTEFI